MLVGTEDGENHMGVLLPHKDQVHQSIVMYLFIKLLFPL